MRRTQGTVPRFMLQADEDALTPTPPKGGLDEHYLRASELRLEVERQQKMGWSRPAAGSLRRTPLADYQPAADLYDWLEIAASWQLPSITDRDGTWAGRDPHHKTPATSEYLLLERAGTQPGGPGESWNSSGKGKKRDPLRPTPQPMNSKRPTDQGWPLFIDAQTLPVATQPAKRRHRRRRSGCSVSMAMLGLCSLSQPA